MLGTHVASLFRGRTTIEQDSAERELAAIVNSSDDAIIGKRLDGTILSWNRAAERLYGYSSDEALGQNVSMLVPPSRIEETKEIFALLSVGGHVRHFETDRLTREGRILRVSLSIAPIANARGEIVGAASIARDLTPDRHRLAELEALEGQLVQAQKMESLGRLAGGVAHDFNNLLLVIRGYAELLEREGEGRGRDRAHEIMKATDHAASLTRQLLTFSRQQDVDPEELDLNELVDETADMLRRLVGSEIELVWEPATRPAPVRADPNQLQQVLLNLVVNAKDAMGDAGTVRLRTRHVTVGEELAAKHLDAVPGEYALLTVCDTGPGIDSQTLARIFDPFFTTKPPGSGTGLGLSTVYGIVRRHDGFVTVDSAPGEPTTFGVYLPTV